MMAPAGLNPDYEREQRRRRSLIVLAAVLLVTVVASARWLLQRETRSNLQAPAEEALSARATTENLADSLPETAAAPWPPAAVPVPEDAPFADVFDDEEAEPSSPTPGQDFPADFVGRKALAFALYRRNDLEGARRLAQAALAMQRDDELIDLLMRLEQEIRVQRHYDNARLANFIVLFDGYEHDEIKASVLGLLKEAYAEIGKALGRFPPEPVTVILYSGKDFSDVTRAPEWAGGMFGQLDGKIRVPVQGVAGQEAALRRVLFHEYTHALLYAIAPNCPMWLHEGLAQYLSGERGVSIGQVIPLALLAAGFPSDARAAYAAYMESLQVVSDLVNERGMPSLRRLLNELGAGKNLEQAFAAAYGQPFSRWAASWRPVAGRSGAEEDDG